VFGEFKQKQESLISEGAERMLEAKIGVKEVKQLLFDFCGIISSKLLKPSSLQTYLALYFLPD
jgi:hypothetical protein